MSKTDVYQDKDSVVLVVGRDDYCELVADLASYLFWQDPTTLSGGRRCEEARRALAVLSGLDEDVLMKVAKVGS